MANLYEALSKLDKKYNPAKRREGWKAISTGSIVIDYISGVGGFPIGGINELAGEEATGKTTLCMQAIRNAQRKFPNKKVLVIDSENTWNLSYAEVLGVDTSKDNLLFYQEMSIEGAQEITQELVRTGEISLFVLDSVANLHPMLAITDPEEAYKQKGLHARLFAPWFGNLSGDCNNFNTCCIAVNQFRAKLDFKGYGAGSSIQTAGGNALKYYKVTSLWLEPSTSEFEEVESDVSLDLQKEAQRIHIRGQFKKNKAAAPFKKGKYVIEFGKGIDNTFTLIEVAIKRNVIEKAGQFFTMPGGDKIRGEAKMKATVYGNKELQLTIAKTLGWLNYENYQV